MVCDTQASQDAFTYQIWNSYFKEYRRYTPVSKNYVRGQVQGHSDLIMVCYTSLSQDASTHQI